MFFGAAVFAYGLDRLTKYLVEHHLAARGPVVLIPHVVELRYTTNSGGAFGILGSEPWLFFGATIVVSAVIVVAALRVDTLPTLLGMGLILGGALGNLTDRIGHARVTDFIDFHVWPVFNAADSAIVIGAIVVALAGTRRSNA